MDPSILTVLLSAILGGGGLGAFLTWRKTSAEAESVSVATLRGVIEELREEIRRTREENEFAMNLLREENARLRERLAILENRA